MAKPKCVHHYVLPGESGPDGSVVGTCKFCGDKKTHFNFVPGKASDYFKRSAFSHGGRGHGLSKRKLRELEAGLDESEIYR